MYVAMGLSPGVEPMMKWLKENGVKTIIISAACEQFTKFVAEKLGMDGAYGTKYEIEDGVFTGRVLEKCTKKAEILREVAGEMGFKPEECAAVGDSSVDIEMLRFAGLGIGFKPKSILAKETDYNIEDFREIIKIIKSI